MPADENAPPPMNPQTASNPPTVEPPLTSSTGWGFDAPDAGVGVAPDTVRPAQTDSASPRPHAQDPNARPLPQAMDAGLPDVETTDVTPAANVSGELDAVPDRPTAETAFSPGTGR